MTLGEKLETADSVIREGTSEESREREDRVTIVINSKEGYGRHSICTQVEQFINLFVCIEGWYRRTKRVKEPFSHASRKPNVTKVLDALLDFENLDCAFGGNDVSFSEI